MSKKPPVQEESSRSDLHNKYRPRTLDKIIGHTDVVSQLKAAVDKGKWPSAIAFFGPPSAGKTTLAYALASTAFEGRNVQSGGHPDMFELVGTESKTIEDVRSLVSMAHMRPSREKRRFILLEEAQGLLSNQQAAACALAALERPRSPQTTWLLTSMSPEKFMDSTNGKAILTRCVNYHLDPPSPEDLAKYAKRIRKGESMEYVSDEVIDMAVQSSEGQMRTLANLMQKLQMWAEGQDKLPKKVPAEVLGRVLVAAGGSDDETALNYLIAIYNGKLGPALRHALGFTDAFQAISKMLSMNMALMNDLALKGERHPKVWVTAPVRLLKTNLKDTSLDDMARMTEALARMRAQAMSFAMPEQALLSSFAASMALHFKKGKK